MLCKLHCILNKPMQSSPMSSLCYCRNITSYWMVAANMYISHAGLVLGMLSYFVAELLFERLYVRVIVLLKLSHQ